MIEYIFITQAEINKLSLLCIDFVLNSTYDEEYKNKMVCS